MKTTRHLFLGLLSLFLISSLLFGTLTGFQINTQTKAPIENLQLGTQGIEKEQEQQTKRQESESEQLEDEQKNSVSTLTFNVIYYLIYKFKPADLL